MTECLEGALEACTTCIHYALEVVVHAAGLGEEALDAGRRGRAAEPLARAMRARCGSPSGRPVDGSAGLLWSRFHHASTSMFIGSCAAAAGNFSRSVFSGAAGVAATAPPCPVPPCPALTPHRTSPRALPAHLRRTLLLRPRHVLSA